MIVLDTLKDCFRFGSQKYNSAVFLHFHDIALPHRCTAATGNHHIASGLHLHKKLRLQFTEILFPIGFKNIGNAHALSLGNDLIHLHNIHGKYRFQEVRDRRLTGSHKADQDNIVIEEFSGLNALAVGTDAVKYIGDLFFMLSAFHSAFQPFLLLCLLLRLQNLQTIRLFTGHNIFYNPVTHDQCIQNDLIALSKTLSQYIQLTHTLLPLSFLIFLFSRKTMYCIIATLFSDNNPLTYKTLYLFHTFFLLFHKHSRRIQMHHILRTDLQLQTDF